jgi:hypothetical protein
VVALGGMYIALGVMGAAYEVVLQHYPIMGASLGDLGDTNALPLTWWVGG